MKKSRELINPEEYTPMILICQRETDEKDGLVQFYLKEDGKVIEMYMPYELNPSIAPLSWKIKKFLGGKK